jgi:hypothetical protein
MIELPSGAAFSAILPPALLEHRRTARGVSTPRLVEDLNRRVLLVSRRHDGSPYNEDVVDIDHDGRSGSASVVP